MPPRSLPLLALLAFLVVAPSAAAASKPYDFDGDGRQERVAGLPDLAVGGHRLAGAILVVEGKRRALITESSAGLPGGSEDFNRFGTDVASGDFNGDGYADLAVGSAESDPASSVDRGAVTVMRGSATGLTTAGAVRFVGPVVTLPGDSFERGTGFGETLAAADLNRDGADDLVVTALFEDPTPSADFEAGTLHLLFGGAAGLTRTGERVLARPRRHDSLFGFALALGDVDRDGHVDIVEGAPGEASSIDFEDTAGHVSYCAGTAAGPTSCRAVSPKQRSGTGGSGRKREAPASLAVGDVTGDGFPDIVEGVPEDRVHGEESRLPPGAILIRRGTRRGPAKRVLRITEATRGVPGRAEERDAFGAAVAVGRIDRDRFADIAVGATGEDGHGRVTVLRGGPHGVSRRGARAYDRDTRGMPRTGPGLGAALTLLDNNGDRRLDLTIGSHGVFKSNGLSAKGTVVTLFGRRRALTTKRAVGIDWTDIGAGPRTGTALGTVLGR